MSDVPSWLKEEDTVDTAVKVANNPVLRGAAVSAASNPAVRNAVVKNITQPPPPPPPSNNSRPSPSNHDVEAARPSDATTNSEFIIEDEILKQMKTHHLILRIAYIAASIFLSAAAALALSNQSDIGIVFFSFYVFFFSVLLCCFEFALSVSPCCLNQICSIV